MALQVVEQPQSVRNLIRTDVPPHKMERLELKSHYNATGHTYTRAASGFSNRTHTRPPTGIRVASSDHTQENCSGSEPVLLRNKQQLLVEGCTVHGAVSFYLPYAKCIPEPLMQATARSGHTLLHDKPPASNVRWFVVMKCPISQTLGTPTPFDSLCSTRFVSGGLHKKE